MYNPFSSVRWRGTLLNQTDHLASDRQYNTIQYLRPQQWLFGNPGLLIYILVFIRPEILLVLNKQQLHKGSKGRLVFSVNADCTVFSRKRFSRIFWIKLKIIHPYIKLLNIIFLFSGFSRKFLHFLLIFCSPLCILYDTQD